MTKALLINNFQYSVIRPGSIVSSVTAYSVINRIIEVSKHFDFCFVVNDNHNKNDIEFKYLPPHSIRDTQDTVRLLDLEKKISSKYFYVMTKATLSGFNHRMQEVFYQPNSLLENSKIYVAGFNASTDIIATCLSLIDSKHDIAIIPSCIDDVDKTVKETALNYLKYLGIPFEEFE
jgi:hypothetical protein